MRPLSLTDRQLDIISETARALPVEKRDAFLQRFAAMVGQRSGRITGRQRRRGRAARAREPDENTAA